MGLLTVSVCVSPIQYTGTIQGTGTIGNRVTIGSSSRAKRFHRHHREQWHYSTVTIGAAPLCTRGKTKKLVNKTTEGTRKEINGGYRKLSGIGRSRVPDARVSEPLLGFSPVMEID